MKPFVRPVRTVYKHSACGKSTTIGPSEADIWARMPSFYSLAYCAGCDQHRPKPEFHWEDGTEVGS